MAATVSAVSFDLRLGPLRSASSPATPASTSAAAVPTGRAPSSVSGRGGCAVITAIIHRPTVRLTSQYLLLSTRPGPRTRHTGKSADHSTELPTGHRLHVRSPDPRLSLYSGLPAPRNSELTRAHQAPFSRHRGGHRPCQSEIKPLGQYRRGGGWALPRTWFVSRRVD